MTEAKEYHKNGLEVAVIGLSGRFPGAKNIEEFWNNLKNGIESISFFSDQELEQARVDPDRLKDSDFVKTRGGVFENREYFDAAFFGYTPGEAEVMDVQMRVFHECSWAALEDAGYHPDLYEGLIGLYAGASPNFNWEARVRLSGKINEVGAFAAQNLINKDYLSTRLSFRLNLKGPSFTVNTACSTSLVVIHLACQAILNGECDMALAGGVSISSGDSWGYSFQEGMISSPDGHCRAFDAKAKGTAVGYGIGIVVLKILEDALADGDYIYAVIKGTAINNDGIRKAGYTAPSIEGQVGVIKAAHQVAEVEPESINYIEAHGTGTVLGDPIEVEALKRAFHSGKKGFCALGSVKTNIGHLDAAAGAAGFIKTVLALHHRLIPPNLHFETPNPKIDFENSPFYVNTTLKEWKSDDYPLRAGVSSFGIGGTNAHVILEEAPRTDDRRQTTEDREQSQRRGGISPPGQSRRYQLILLSAKTETALDRMTENLAKYFKHHPDINLADAAYTLQAGRAAFKHRKMFVCSQIDEAIENLSSNQPGKVNSNTFFPADEHDDRSVVFMFPGQGSQYVNMGVDLYRTEPVFREAMNRCFEILTPLMGYGIKKILYPGERKAQGAERKANKRHAPGAVRHAIEQTEIAQPLIFSFEYALAQLLIKWGVKPDAMIGHSIGEYAAAHLAGVFSLQDALKLVALRGQLMQQMPTGSMLGVPLSEEQLQPLINQEISIAAINSSSNCAVSGPHLAIDAFEKQLKEKGWESSRLHTSHAFHSMMMDPMVTEFEARVRQVQLNKPQIPYISNLTGTWITPGQTLDHTYWGKHLRKTVRFHQGMQELVKKPGSVFVEVGPGRTLNTFARQDHDKKPGIFIVNLVKHPKEKAKKNVSDHYYLLSKLGQLWLYGKEIHWPGFHAGEKRTRIPLPSYPFEGQRYWIEGVSDQPGTTLLPDDSSLRKKPDITDWFYVPSWKRSNLVNAKERSIHTTYLVFMDNCYLGHRLVQQIRQKGGQVIVVKIGTTFSPESGPVYRINPGESNHYEALLKELQAADKIPGTIIHMWNVTTGHKGQLTPERVKKGLDLGFYSLVHIARAIGTLGITNDIALKVISNHLHELIGDEDICPEKAPVLGPVKVIPQEYSHINCQSIDIVWPEPGSNDQNRVINQLLTELTRESVHPDRVVAYRGNHRWVQTFEPMPGQESNQMQSLLKKGGVYLVTGGLGNIGLLLAEFLAKNFKTKLVLTARSPFPPRKQWGKWLHDHEQDTDQGIAGKILKIQELETSGAEISVYPADAANYQQMQRVIADAEKRYGCLNGIIHCAGVTGALKPLNRTDKNHCEEQFQAKVYGLLALNAILKDKTDSPPDFCLLMSSLSSVLGGLGFTAYSAANLFMDSFVHARTDSPWLSVNWDGWQFGETNRSAAAMTPEQGIKAFQHIFSLKGVRQILVSTGDLQKRIHQWIRLETLKAEEHSPKEIKPALQLRPNLSSTYEAPRNPLEQKLTEIWQQFFGIEKVGIHDNFFELGGDSLKGMTLVNRYKKLLGEMVYVQVVFEAPTIAELAIFFREHYSRAVKAVLGQEAEEDARELYPKEKIDAARLAMVRQLIPSLPPEDEIDASAPKNPPAIFILSPSRSGSTLLRVMLAGHPRLFSPPEMNLLTKNTLEGITNGEGVIRAVMQVKSCGVQEAKRLLKGFEDQQMNTRAFYRLLQNWLGGKILVDKTPMYALNLDVLKRAEQIFENPYYIHLVRHPYGMIRSKEEVRLNLVRGILKDLSVSRYEKAELEWIICQQNILEFFKQIPANRQYRIRFEDLVKEPRHIMEKTCQFLGLKFHPEMLHPYKNKKERMTDGIYSQGIMRGDPKFHEHQTINPDVADKWKTYFKKDFLSDITWQIAASFGYEQPQKSKSAYQPIKAAEKKEYYVLSSAQRRLYVLHQLDPDSLGYNLPGIVSPEAKIDQWRLENVFRQLIRRHEILRTSFVMKDEEPVQLVHNKVEFKIEYYDLYETQVEAKAKVKEREGTRGLAPLLKETTTRSSQPATALISSFIRPFDLTKPPLLRLGLIKTGNGKTLLLMDKHHIISDVTTHQLLMQEFKELYKGNQLKPQRLQYKDYSQWQNSKEQQEILRQQGAFWIDLFSSADQLPVLQLPLDYPRPQVQSFAGDIIGFQLDETGTAHLKKAAKQADATLYMIILALFYILLAKLSRQEDIIVGTPIAARRHEDLENIIGMFINTLAMRNYPGKSKRFKDFLKDVKENALKAYENQEYPFEELVDKIAVRRDTSRNPIFDVMFRVISQAEFKADASANNNRNTHDTLQKTSIFDLDLAAKDFGKIIHFDIRYCTKLFRPGTIKRFVKYFKRITAAVLKNPELKLTEIEIISDEEKNQLLYDFNQTQTEYPRDKTIHQLFEEQVKRTPDYIAVVGAHQLPSEETRGLAPLSKLTSITYKELNQKSHQLAQPLKEKGVKPDTTVGVMVNRSVEMIMGILAILKADGAYLPIDPGYPGERIHYILKNSSTKILVTTPQLFKEDGKMRRWEDKKNLEIIFIDGFKSSFSPSHHLTFSPSSSLAYVIYTSGSTGNPKGVMIRHQNVVNFIKGMTDKMVFSPGKTILAITTISFDISILEILLPLTCGMRIIIANEQEQADPHLLETVIRRNQVNMMQITPSRLQLLLKWQDRQRTLETVDQLLVGGETFPVHLFEQVKEKFQGKIYNVYGPTETTIWSTEKDLSRSRSQELTIGNPIANTQVYIVDIDRHTRLQPIGVPGELLIGGHGVAVGYLNNPELTFQRFICAERKAQSAVGKAQSLEQNKERHALCAVRHTRTYRTGDLARWLFNGEIEFLGRWDDQVKIRGFRIDLEEIEEQLLKHKNIKEAVAISKSNPPGDHYLCAYIVPIISPGLDARASFAVSPRALNVSELRASLSRQLPDYMIPSDFVQVETIPLTPNGKIDRKALRQYEGQQLETGVTYAAPETGQEKLIARLWQEVLKRDNLGIHDNFFDLGGNSMNIIQLNSKLKKALGREVPVVTLFRYPTIQSLLRYLNEEEPPGEAANEEFDQSLAVMSETMELWETLSEEKEETFKPDKTPGEKDSTSLEVAVIGMAGRFPGASHLQEFWNNLLEGVELVTFFTEKELEGAGVRWERLTEPNYVKAAPVMENSDCFDAAFFDYTPLEAQVMDPQSRIFLECTWQALEDAGYNPGSYKGMMGLYAGASGNFYWEGLSRLSGPKNASERFAQWPLLDKDFLSTDISYKLNLRGPSTTIYTACSTSLLAVHMACRALLAGECKIALAGGVTIGIMKRNGYHYQAGMITSPDGHCRAFDARANGTVFGDGAGIVVLKRLKYAIADNDHIYAVIKGSAVNNDGNRKVGFTAPSVDGQREVIGMAHRIARVEPESITYVEAHGSGTPLGDPVEIEALKLAFNTSKKGFCSIGSIKTNIGHLDVAAGVAGFIKTVLALKHHLIPPSLHFETANPEIDFHNTPFYVNTALKKWEHGKYPLRAGVSSIGIGGTNVHVVLEEWPMDSMPVGQCRDAIYRVRNKEVSPPGQSREYQLILLSAKTPSALDKMTKNLSQYLKNNPGINLDDAAYTLQVGRKAFKHRRMWAASPGNTLPPSDGIHSVVVTEENSKVVFMFPGLGAQYVNMGRELYKKEPVFRQEMDHCFEILDTLVDFDMKNLLYPRDAVSERKWEDGKMGREEDRQIGKGPHHSLFTIHHFEVAQLVIFIFEYALTKLLMKWGITPYAMIGYSFGEYAAACISGVLSLEDTLKLIAVRGQLLRQQPAGIMLSVPAALNQVKPLLSDGCSIAIDNGTSCIVSGPAAEIEAFEKKMKKKRYVCMRLKTSHALHSKMMDPVLEKFADAIRRRNLSGNQPRIPYISNVTGQWLTVEQARDPGYWVSHLRETVQFADGFNQLAKESHCIFIEVGPGRDLTTLVQRYTNENPGQHTLDLIPVPDREISNSYYLLNKIGQLWLYGVEIHWSALYEGEKRHRISLPLYPFEGQRYMIEKNAFNLAVPGTVNAKKKDIADWFYIPSWKRSILEEPDHDNRNTGKKRVHLVFLDENGLGSRLVERIKHSGQAVIGVKMGKTYVPDKRAYQVRPGNDQDYKQLFHDLKASNHWPHEIIHLWGLTRSHHRVKPQTSSSDSLLDRGFYSLLFIAQSLATHHFDGDINITAVGNQVCKVTGEEVLSPGKATVLGPLKVIPQEYPGIHCRCLDIVLPPLAAPEEQVLVEQLFKEISTPSSHKIAALRHGFRWVQVFEPIRLNQTTSSPSRSRLREKGVYIITGGLGNIGGELAKYLGEKFQARLVLTSRSPLPARDRWPDWLSQHGKDDPISRKIKKLLEIEETGAQVLVKTADAADLDAMHQVVRHTRQRFGKINGAIHAAGIVRHCPIKQMTRPEAQQYFHAKMDGLEVLKEVLENKNPHPSLDFCLLLSSSASVLGGLGYAAYAAANIFMDTFAQEFAGKSPFPWIAYNLDIWNYPGKKHPAARPGGSTLEPLAMTLEEGLIAFQRVLNCRQAPQVVQSTGNLQVRLDKWIHLEPQLQMETDVPGTAAQDRLSHSHPRPPLLTPYVPPQNKLQHQLTGIWQGLLGIRTIGIEDDFFELGGDSLKAISVIARIHKQLNAEVPLVDFFNQRTISKVAEYIQKKTGKNTLPSIEPREEKEYYPLSSAQKRSYILQQMDPGTLGYNLASTVLLEGKLDTPPLKTSFCRLIQRHESFRTSFDMVEGEPVQRVHDKVEFAIRYYDLTTIGREVELAARRSQLKASTIENFIRPFDLAQAPLLRVGLIKVEEEQHVLITDMPHIIHDGISQTIMFKEFMVFWAGDSLPPLKLRYKDYAQWQQRYLEEGTIKKQEKYWLNSFKGEIPVLNLPVDYPRPALQSHAGRTIHFRIAEDEANALREFALKEEATLFIVLLSIYIVFLSRLSGQEDLVVGTPIAGRKHPDLEPLIGFFLNTLPLRNFPSADKSFRALLKEIKERTLTAFDNQDYSFEELVEKVVVNRNLGRSPLFDVMFIFQNQFQSRQREISPQTKRNLTIKSYPYETRTSEFDITLVGSESEDDLFFKIQYCTKLFKEESMHRLINYFKNLVAVILKDPEIKLAEIEILSPPEKKQVLDAFNDTNTQYPHDKTIHQLFAEQVNRTPHHTALIGKNPKSEIRNPNQEGTRGLAPLPGTLNITYKELNQKSDQLAYVLKEKAVKPDSIVGIMVERSVEMIIGIFGILKAGGAYLPIDPDYPEERIDFMLKDSGTKILLSAGHHPDLPSSPPPFFSHLPIFPSSQLPSFSHLHLSPAPVTSLAYIIYTSGSTGNPKGVMVQHNHAVNFITGMTSKIAFSPGKTILALTTISFDIFFLETLLPVTCGLKVVIAGQHQQKDPGLLADILTRNQVNMLQLTPSGLQSLVNFNDQLTCLDGIQELMVGGEVFPANLFEKLKKRFKGKIYNMYGPTETTIWSAVKDLSRSRPEEITIGKPIANTRVYITDRCHRVQPVGIAGELLIGGDGVARGYLNNPELTAEKFLCAERKAQSLERNKERHALCAMRHARIYRTGDLARWLSSGEIQCLGRIDLQVKIRGYRIELEEIEKTLLRHPGIKEAVVISKVNRTGDKYLAAYIVLASSLETKTSPWSEGDGMQLKEYLSQKLPAYMVPAYLVPLNRIQLLPNGKVDRNALPEPEVSANLGATFVAPETAKEKIIAQLWKDVLQVDKVGLHDNFFERGGNSLNVIQLNRKLKETFGKNIPVSVMFRDLTISFLVRYLAEHRDQESSDLEKEEKETRALTKRKQTYKDTIRKLRGGVNDWRTE